MQVNRLLGMAVAILTLSAGFAWAGSEERQGTGGAPELRLPVGARSVALSSADLAMVSGAEALFYNPAGMAASANKTEVMVSHTEFIADMKVNYLGITQAMGFGVLGVSAKVLSIGEIVRTTESSPDGLGDVFSPTFSNIGVSVGKQMTDRVNFGASLYFISERVLQTNASGMSFDFGFQYDTGWRGIRLGMAMKNFGPNMQYGGADFDRIIQLPGDDPQSSGRNVRQEAASFELPSTFQMSAGLPVITGDNPLLLFGTFSSNSFFLSAPGVVSGPPKHLHHLRYGHGRRGALHRHAARRREKRQATCRWSPARIEERVTDCSASS